MDQHKNLIEDMTKISDVVTAAREIIEGGQVINIQPLEKEVEDLCAKLTGVDAESAREIQPILLGLMEELNHLAQTMDDCHRELTSEIRSLDAHGTATNAYSAPPSKAKK